MRATASELRTSATFANMCGDAEDRVVKRGVEDEAPKVRCPASSTPWAITTFVSPGASSGPKTRQDTRHEVGADVATREHAAESCPSMYKSSVPVIMFM